MPSNNDPEWGARRNLQNCEHKSARAKECLQELLIGTLPGFDELPVGTRQRILYSIRHAMNILDGTEEVAIQAANPFSKG